MIHKNMNVFLILAFLFFIGSIAGWVMELFFRRIISTGKWINPGFLVGPYLPLYGFGLCTFYLLSQIQLNSILVIIIMGITVTAIEYIAGLIFIKGMGIKLWDYSGNFGNIDRSYMPDLFFNLVNIRSNILLFYKSLYNRFVVMA